MFLPPPPWQISSTTSLPKSPSLHHLFHHFHQQRDLNPQTFNSSSPDFNSILGSVHDTTTLSPSAKAGSESLLYSILACFLVVVIWNSPWLLVRLWFSRTLLWVPWTMHRRGQDGKRLKGNVKVKDQSPEAEEIRREKEMNLRKEEEGDVVDGRKETPFVEIPLMEQHNPARRFSLAPSYAPAKPTTANSPTTTTFTTSSLPPKRKPKGLHFHPFTNPSTPPPRLPNIHLPFIPLFTIPYLHLTLTQFIIIASLWAVGFITAFANITTFLWDATKSGYVAVGLLAIGAAFGIKCGGVGTWIGLGYAGVNFLHRWIGRLICLITTLHVVAYVVLFVQNGVFAVEMRQTANYLGAIAFGGLLILTILSMGIIRRRYWIVFKVGHHIGILLLIVGLNYHSVNVLPYLIFIIVVILSNFLFRSITTRFHLATLTHLPSAHTTLIQIPTLNTGFVAGQHCKIRVFTREKPMGWRGWLESHPFTIASAEGGEGIRLLVKGGGDFTNGLLEMAERGEVVPVGTNVGDGQGIEMEMSPIESVSSEGLGEIKKVKQRKVWISVEGPYGGPLKTIFPAFSSVLIAAGGSGISFALAVSEGIIRDLKSGRAATRKLILMWTVRELGNLEDLYPILNGLIKEGEGVRDVIGCEDFEMEVKLFWTGKSKSKAREDGGHGSGKSEEVEMDLERSERTLHHPTSSNITITITSSRPDFSSILQQLALDTAPTTSFSEHELGLKKRGGGIGVGGCGPLMMVEDMERCCRKVGKGVDGKRAGGITFHAEAFSL